MNGFQSKLTVVLLSCLVLLGQACDKAKDYYQNLPKVDEVKDVLKAGETAPKSVHADFVIEGAKVYYKGVHLPFNNFDKWLSVLGKETRIIRDVIKDPTHIWDDLGIRCSLRKNVLVEYEVWFRNLESLGLDAKNERDRELMETIPKKLFSKDIIIDGAVINKYTPIS